MKSIAIIPARSGSKGLPDKNILDLNGKPLMYYTIKAAIDSNRFDEIMVSTDSEKYAEIARECGANVPFLRSEEMSNDSASSWDTVREVLEGYKKIGKTFDYVVLLQPTSPLRDAKDINVLYETFEKNGARNAVTVTQVDHPVQWCFELGENGSMDKMAASPYSYMRRQDLEPYYRENGAIYLVDAHKIMDKTYNFYADNCIASIMPREKSIDIDTEIDFVIAKEYMNKAI